MSTLVTEMLETIETYRKLGRPEELLDGRIVQTLSTKSRDNSIHFLRIPMANMRQPALEIEREYGLTGIAGHYRLPDGLTPEYLQLYTHVMNHAEMRGDISAEEHDRKMNRVLGTLEELNPELKALKVPDQTADRRFDLLLGIASDYNVKDIQFYLSGNTGSVATRDPGWAALYLKTQQRVPLGWIPCPDTLEKIDAQATGLNITRRELPPEDPEEAGRKLKRKIELAFRNAGFRKSASPPVTTAALSEFSPGEAAALQAIFNTLPKNRPTVGTVEIKIGFGPRKPSPDGV